MDGWHGEGYEELECLVTGKERHKNGMVGESFRGAQDPQSVVVSIKIKKNNNNNK
jgi:hypothetical protein